MCEKELVANLQLLYVVRDRCCSSENFGARRKIMDDG
jgi:hypothetical protein